MKRKYLVSLIALFLLCGCNKSESKKETTSQAFSVTSNTSTVTPTSSTQPNPSSSSVPIPTEGFCFSQSKLTIDISSTHSASLSFVNSDNKEESVTWSVPRSNVIRFDKTSTKHGEVNTIHAIRTGSVRLKGEANGKTAFCDINVINSKIKPTSGTQNISIYAINDYHGAVSNEFSLRHLGTLIKQKVSQNNTLFLDQGDTFQGSLLSNYNRGRMITDVYNAAGMSGRTVGNHDFDWGADKLIASGNAQYHGYSTPVLAANVYDFSFQTKEVGTTQQSQIGQEYVTFTLESGIKVGVIGVIGDTCETSINTQFVEDFEFINAANMIRSLSDTLRVEEDCDVIIASIHDGYSSYLANRVTATSSVTNKKYVDLVLNGHTHEWVNEEYNGVTFAQFGEKGETIGKVNLTYDYATGSVTSTNVYNLSSSSLISDVPTIDPEIDAICDHYEAQVASIKDEVLTSRFYTDFSAYDSMPNLVCKAIYEESITQGFDISYSIINNAREPLSGPTVTYEKLYTSLPFDNVIYIIKVSGADIENEMNYNYMYRGNNADALAALDTSKTYTIACIDYLAFHCNSSRYYNYFPSLSSIDGYLEKNDEYYTYREITADYLRNKSGDILSGDYSKSLDHHNKNKLGQSITAE